MSRAALGLTTSLVAILLLAGCSAGVDSAVPSGNASRTPFRSPARTNIVVVPQDATAFAQLEQVAPKTVALKGGTVTSTTCWTPSEHLLNDPSIAPAGTWKVLCRVNYDLKGVRRYQDATCIGDFDLAPMLNHCYVWEYYNDVPRYGDGNRLSSPPPRPLP